MIQPHDETVLAAGGGQFPETCWSVLHVSTGEGDTRYRLALEHLVRMYWSPVYHFIRRKGRPVEDAKDLTQDFFAWALDREFIRHADAGRGRFRTFLLTSLENFLRDDFDRRAALKRGGGRAVLSLTPEVLEGEEAVHAGSAGPSAEEVFNRRWALAVMEAARKRLQAQCEGRGESEAWSLFRWLVLDPGAGPFKSYAEASAALGLTEGQINARLTKARRSFRDLVVEEIRQSCGPGAVLAEELDLLLASLRIS